MFIIAGSGPGGGAGAVTAVAGRLPALPAAGRLLHRLHPPQARTHARSLARFYDALACSKPACWTCCTCCCSKCLLPCVDGRSPVCGGGPFCKPALGFIHDPNISSLTCAPWQSVQVGDLVLHLRPALRNLTPRSTTCPQEWELARPAEQRQVPDADSKRKSPSPEKENRPDGNDAATNAATDGADTASAGNGPTPQAASPFATISASMGWDTFHLVRLASALLLIRRVQMHRHSPWHPF
jgi:hypothetical protein